jgi:hypothetical protein
MERLRQLLSLMGLHHLKPSTLLTMLYKPNYQRHEGYLMKAVQLECRQLDNKYLLRRLLILLGESHCLWRLQYTFFQPLH